MESPESSESSRSLLRKIAATAASSIAARAAAAALAALVARGLGPAAQGQLALAFVVVDLGGQFGTFGLHQANSHRVATDRALLSRLLGNSLLVAFTIGLIGACAAATFYARQEARVPVALLATALLVIPLSSLTQLMGGLTWGLSEVRYANAIAVGKSVLQLLLIFGAVQFRLLTPLAALLAAATSMFFAATANLLLLVTKHRARPVLSRVLLGECAGFGARWWANSFLVMLLEKGVFFVIASAKGGERETGYLWAALGIAEFMNIMPGAAATVSLPYLSRTADMAERWRLAKRVGRVLTTTMALQLIPLVLGMTPIITLSLGADYLPAASSCAVLSIGMLSEGAGRPYYFFLAASNRHGMAIYTSLVSNAVALVGVWLLVPTHGIIGAACALSAGQVVGVALLYGCARYLLARSDGRTV